MDEMDDLIDSLLQPKTSTEVNYIDDKYDKEIKVKDTPKKGQGIFAERALSVKDSICSLPYPTMMAIHSDFLPTTCYYCLIVTQSPVPLPDHGPKLESLKTCNGCQSVRFCGRDCQVKAWHAYHKYECKIFTSMRADLPPDLFRAVLSYHSTPRPWPPSSRRVESHNFTRLPRRHLHRPRPFQSHRHSREHPPPYLNLLIIYERRSDPETHFHHEVQCHRNPNTHLWWHRCNARSHHRQNQPQLRTQHINTPTTTHDA